MRDSSRRIVNNRGDGRIEAFIWMALIAGLVLLLIRLVPIYYDNFEVNNLWDLVAVKLKSSMEDDDIQRLIVRTYRANERTDFDINKLTINRDFDTLKIIYAYSVPVDYPVIGTIFTIHFELSRKSADQE